MAINKEWRCFGHGTFESDQEKPLCPFAGCDTVERVFLTPVGLGSARTKNIDNTFSSLAKTYGMTDIDNRGGRAAKRAPANHEQKQRELAKIIRERYGNGWGEVPQGGTYNTQTKQVEGGGAGAMGALARYGAAPANTVEQVREALVPKPVLYRHDHEGLNVGMVNK